MEKYLLGFAALIYLAAIIGVILVIVSLWRSMKAQEAMVRSLERIEKILTPL